MKTDSYHSMRCTFSKHIADVGRNADAAVCRCAVQREAMLLCAFPDGEQAAVPAQAGAALR